MKILDRWVLHIDNNKVTLNTMYPLQAGETVLLEQSGQCMVIKACQVARDDKWEFESTCVIAEAYR